MYNMLRAIVCALVCLTLTSLAMADASVDAQAAAASRLLNALTASRSKARVAAKHDGSQAAAPAPTGWGGDGPGQQQTALSSRDAPTRVTRHPNCAGMEYCPRPKAPTKGPELQELQAKCETCATQLRTGLLQQGCTEHSMHQVCGVLPAAPRHVQHD